MPRNIKQLKNEPNYKGSTPHFQYLVDYLFESGKLFLLPNKNIVIIKMEELNSERCLKAFIQYNTEADKYVCAVDRGLITFDKTLVGKFEGNERMSILIQALLNDIEFDKESPTMDGLDTILHTRMGWVSKLDPDSFGYIFSLMNIFEVKKRKDLELLCDKVTSMGLLNMQRVIEKKDFQDALKLMGGTSTKFS